MKCHNVFVEPSLFQHMLYVHNRYQRIKWTNYFSCLFSVEFRAGHIPHCNVIAVNILLQSRFAQTVMLLTSVWEVL